MKAEIDLGCRFLKVAPRITADRLIYRRTNPDEPVGNVVAATLHDIGYHLGLSAREIASSHFPPVLHSTMYLFARYDDLVDTSSEMPSPEAAYNDPVAQEHRQRLLAAILSTDAPQDRQQAMLEAIGLEELFQYNLHCEYGTKKQPLTVNDAFKFRELAGGSLTTLIPRLLSLLFNKQGPRIEAILDAGYWYGAVFQLIDDVADIGADLPKGMQNAFSSCLYENPDELDRVREGVEVSPVCNYRSLQLSAPRSLERIREQWKAYYGNVQKGAEFPIFHSLLDPAVMAPIITLYSRMSGKINLIRSPLPATINS